MLRARFFLPLIIPSLIICVPTFAYVIGRKAGTLPTREEWQSAAHSSGPWMGSDVFTACYILIIGGLIFTGCGIGFAATTGRGAQLQGWAVQGIGIAIATVTICYFFGWLIW